MSLLRVSRTLNTGLKTAVKRIGMGGYLNTLFARGPLFHERNAGVDGVAFTNCRIFDGLVPELKKNMTLLVRGKISRPWDLLSRFPFRTNTVSSIRPAGR